jgi:hypothetical protein
MFSLAVVLLASAAAGAEPSAAALKVDHLILGAADLEQGIERFAARTGVRPIFGGRHPGRGTQNALASLGDGSYVEILAPVQGAADTPDFRGLSALTELTPVGWAVSTRDVAATVALLAGARFTTSPPRAGARVRPDGRKLEWTTFGIVEPAMEQAPFFIRWGDGSLHPSADSPRGCTLAAFDVSAADDSDLRRLLDRLAPGVAVGRRTTAPLEVVLRCPKGDVRFPAGP